MCDKNYLIIQFYYYKYKLDEKGKYVSTRYQINDYCSSYLFFNAKNNLKSMIDKNSRKDAVNIYLTLHKSSTALNKKQWVNAEVLSRGPGRCLVMTGHIGGLIEDNQFNELNKSLGALQFGTKMMKNGF